MFDKETLIFFVEALALNTEIHEDIDDLYKTKSAAFHKYANKSDLRKHPLIVCGSARHEEYGRKALGILLYAMETHNKSVIGGVDRIIQKGWPRACYNAFNHKSVNIKGYVSELQNACKQNVAGSMAELFVFFSLCVDNKLPIVKKTDIADFFTALALRSFIHTNDRYFDAYNKKSAEEQKKLDSLKDRIYNDFGIKISPDNQIHVSDNELSKYYRFAYRLSYADKIELYYLFREISLDEKDINDVLCAYADVYKSGSDEEAAKAFLSGVIIKLMVKSVIDAKEYYFQHADEQAETFKLEKDIENLTVDNQRLSSENRRHLDNIGSLKEKLRSSNEAVEKPLLDRIRELEKRISKLNDTVRQAQEKERELAALREFFFSLENRESAQEEERAPKTMMDLKDTVGAIIGGAPKWSARMKELLPKWVFILSEGFDKRSLDNIQTIFFFPNNMSHALYYKAVAIAKTKNMDIGFIYSQNEQLALKEIAKTLAKAGG